MEEREQMQAKRDPKRQSVKLLEIEKIISQPKRQKKQILNQAILYGIEMLPDQRMRLTQNSQSQVSMNRHDSHIIREKGDLYENMYMHLADENFQQVAESNKH